MLLAYGAQSTAVEEYRPTGSTEQVPGVGCSAGGGAASEQGSKAGAVELSFMLQLPTLLYSPSPLPCCRRSSRTSTPRGACGTAAPSSPGSPQRCVSFPLLFCCCAVVPGCVQLSLLCCCCAVVPGSLQGCVHAGFLSLLVRSSAVVQPAEADLELKPTPCPHTWSLSIRPSRLPSAAGRRRHSGVRRSRLWTGRAAAGGGGGADARLGAKHPGM